MTDIWRLSRKGSFSEIIIETVWCLVFRFRCGTKTLQGMDMGLVAATLWELCARCGRKRNSKLCVNNHQRSHFLFTNGPSCRACGLFGQTIDWYQVIVGPKEGTLILKSRYPFVKLLATFFATLCNTVKPQLQSIHAFSCILGSMTPFLACQFGQLDAQKCDLWRSIMGFCMLQPLFLIVPLYLHTHTHTHQVGSYVWCFCVTILRNMMLPQWTHCGVLFGDLAKVGVCSHSKAAQLACLIDSHCCCAHSCNDSGRFNKPTNCPDTFNVRRIVCIHFVQWHCLHLVQLVIWYHLLKRSRSAFGWAPLR